MVCKICLLRGGPLEITGGGGGGGGGRWDKNFKNFSVDELFLVQFVCMYFFFRRGSSARIFFSTEHLLILKAHKAPHSLITVPVKVTVSLES